jgi:predicted dehydrogenase
LKKKARLTEVVVGIYSLTWIFQILYHIVPENQRAQPTVASSVTKYDPTGADELTTMILTFPNQGAHGIATTNLRVASNPNADHPSSDPIRIQGTLGEITVNNIFRPTSYTIIPAQNASRGKLADWEYQTFETKTPGDGHGMFYEADECARCVRDGKLESDGLPWEESVVIMKTMDEVRKQADLKYPGGLESVEYPAKV